MIKEEKMTAQKIIHDQLFLRQKSDLAGKNDLQVAINLRDKIGRAHV